MKDILYIHGMGGGSDSRIPSILNVWMQKHRPDIRIIIRTYSFNPAEAVRQIDSWYSEINPSLVIGESMGANHALALLDRTSVNDEAAFKLLLVSPALGGPHIMSRLAFLTKVPGVPALFARIYKPKPGNRQTIWFEHHMLKSWTEVIRQVKASARFKQSVMAFFGKKDHYRRNGIVSVRAWARQFGNYRIYEGTHFMEEEHIHKMLIPAILTGIDEKNL